jgi:histidinol-phosphatase (PHP family)
MSRITSDYHSHHDRCGHATGTMFDYIESARMQGATHFGVSDHGPAYWLWGDHAQPWIQMAYSELINYVDEAKKLQSKYAKKLSVAVGIEADYIERREDDLARMLDAHDFDYVLGSVHYCGADQNGGLVSIFHKARWQHEDAEKTYADYYRLVILAAKSGMFDILSHITAIESYSPHLSEMLMASLYPPVADAIAESGCVVEINTSGYRKMEGDEPFPNRTMLKLLIERGVPLTFSSDCHHPEQVFYGRERVVSLLTELGVKIPIEPVFHTVKRKPIPVFPTG